MNSINIKLLFILSLALTVFSSPLMADSQDAFNKGAEYFDQGGYASAVKSFEKLESQGVKSPALYYNLASSYYMLGDYEKAEKYFNKVRQYKDMRSLAEYNLGLTSLKQNDKKSAQKWFSSVVKNSKDKKLVALAENKLKTKRSQKPSSWVNKKWTAYVSGSLGYDDNVNFAPLGITSEKSDTFSEIVASVDYLFAGDRKNGWLGEAYFYNLNYLNEDLYDEYEFGAGIKKNLTLGKKWQTKYGFDMSKINYAGEDYQTIARLSAEARNSFSRNERLYFRYSYEDINSDKNIFDYLAGWRQKFRAGYRLFHKQDHIRLYYELELNNRDDLTIATGGANDGQYSYSPTRHTLRGRYTSILSAHWHLIGDLSYRASDYPTTPNQNRQDDRFRAAAYADYRFSRDLKLRAKVDYTDNRSTENIFAYKRTVYSLGLSAMF
jgi:hypothetical protein